MNLERAAMRAKLAACKESKLTAERKIKAFAESLRSKLNLTLLSDVSDLDMATINALADELNEHHADLLVARTEIANIEKELD